MGYFDFTFKCKSLGGVDSNLSIILPDKPKDTSAEDFFTQNKKFKVLWLLHGDLQDHKTLLHKTKIEVYAAEHNLIIVTPSVLTSGYSDWPGIMNGINAWSILTEELMPLLYGWFPASDKREDNFVAGVGMGGRAAIAYALAYPEKFAAAADISGSICNLKNEFPCSMNERYKSNLIKNRGLNDYLQSSMNVYQHLHEKMNVENIPRLFFSCGTKEEEYFLFQQTKNWVMDARFNAKFVEIPDAKYDFRCFDTALDLAIDYLLNGKG